MADTSIRFVGSDDIFQLLVVALATWQAIEVFHHGSIFADLRSRLELKSGFWIRLLLCPFCLSVWVGCIFALATWPTRCSDGFIGQVAYVLVGIQHIFVYGLAVARLANLGNDLTHKWCRTPGRSNEISNADGNTSPPV